MQLGLDAVEEPDVDDERGVAVLKALHDELRAFGDAVVRGEA